MRADAPLAAVAALSRRALSARTTMALSAMSSVQRGALRETSGATALRGYILGIGTNIEPEANALRIVEELTARFGEVLVSRFYYTSPVGMTSGRRFINFCAFIRTPIDAEACKAICVEIETSLGRDRGAPHCKTADRPADIDILAPLPGDKRTAREIAGVDYLLQPTREILSLIDGGARMPRPRGELCVLPSLANAPAAVDRDDRAGLKVVG
jgi:2-amino-4-hydroxy-6-hydroxymethyldihydropteridine diphosphokinase